MRGIVVSGIASSDVRSVHSLLRERAKYLTMRSRGLIKFSDSLIQHFNPACRAARAFPELPISRLLMSLNDYDLPIKYIHIDNYRKGFEFFYFLSAFLSFSVALVMFFLTIAPEILQDSFIEVGITAIVNFSVIAMGVMSNYSVVVPVGFGLCLFYLAWGREKYNQKYLQRLPNFFLPIPIISHFEEAIEDDEKKEELQLSMRARYEEISVKKRRNAVYHSNKSDLDEMIHRVRKIKGLKDKSIDDYDDNSELGSTTGSKIFVSDNDSSIKIHISDNQFTSINNRSTKVFDKQNDDTVAIVIKPSVIVKQKLEKISQKKIIPDSSTTLLKPYDSVESKVEIHDDSHDNVSTNSKESLVSLYLTNQDTHEIREIPSGIIIKDTRPFTMHSRQKSSQDVSMSEKQSKYLKKIPQVSFDDFISTGFLEMSEAVSSEEIVINDDLETSKNVESRLNDNYYNSNDDDDDNSSIETTESFYIQNMFNKKFNQTPSQILGSYKDMEDIQDMDDIEDMDHIEESRPSSNDCQEQLFSSRKVRREALRYSQNKSNMIIKQYKENLINDFKTNDHLVINEIGDKKYELRNDNDNSTINSYNEDNNSIETTFLDDVDDNDNSLIVNNHLKINEVKNQDLISDSYSIKSSDNNASLKKNEIIDASNEILHEIEQTNSGIIIRNTRPNTNSRIIRTFNNDDISISSTQSRPLTANDIFNLVQQKKNINK